MLRIAGGTVNQTPLDWQNNTANILAAIASARNEKVDLLCLPELCISGYGCEDMFLSDWLYTTCLEQLEIIRQATTNITVALGIPLIIEGNRYSSACLLSNEKILGFVCKQHLANDGIHYEPRWFSAWPAGVKKQITLGGQQVPVGDLTFQVHHITVGFEICEDGWRGNDRPGYNLAKAGVDLILNPSASHFAMGKVILREKEVILQGSANFNCVYVFANLLGNEAGRVIYDGDIIIANQDQILVQSSRLTFHRHKIAYADIDFENSDSTTLRIDDTKDRFEELTRATTLGLYDYLRKSKAAGFVLSLSGGADSGMCAVLVAEMIRRASNELGWDQFCQELNLDPSLVKQDAKQATRLLLTCAYQSTVNSSKETLDAATCLAESIGATFYHWNIDDEVGTYTSKIELALGRKLDWESDDIALQNIQARARSPIIWLLANIKKSILLTTSNRSEGDVGYATMDGDTSGSLAPIAGLSKVFVLKWLKWAQDSLGYSGLKSITPAVPTAELRPQSLHQSDESDLMPYPILDSIEHYAIEKRKSPLDVYLNILSVYETTDKELLRSYVRKFFRLWSHNQWKRERLAPSFHLDSLNVDPRTWCRFPILSSNFEVELKELELYKTH